jgi:hypothetical protein
LRWESVRLRRSPGGDFRKLARNCSKRSLDLPTA